MKYSIRGNLNAVNSSEVVFVINQHTLWRLVTKQEQETFIFEVWINTISDKDSLFNALKPFVNKHSEVIDWHECTHDEINPSPCIIKETFIGGD